MSNAIPIVKCNTHIVKFNTHIVDIAQVKELNEEREKYRKQLEMEYKKLQGLIHDGTEQFDEALKHLFQKKINTEMVIYQVRVTFNILLTKNHGINADHEQKANIATTVVAVIFKLTFFLRNQLDIM